jgi:hypothetical protein
MKLTIGINLLSTRNVEKTLSKKILLANTSDKINTSKLGKGIPSDPIYFSNSSRAQYFNNDIRYRSNYGYSPLTSIDGRNALLLFAENTEIKKAVKAICNEIIVAQLKDKKYPVYPTINLTNIHEDKLEVGKAIQAYLDDIFYPKLFQMVGFKKDGLMEIVKEFMVTGKWAAEIVYDNLKNPDDIVNIVPIDPSTLQKFKQDNYVYYIQRPMGDSIRERILHENQVILVEWNKFDFGYISYVDQLRRPFNIMRSMQTAKILWFAVKSQVRMHIKLNLGDVSRQDAIQKLAIAKSDYINTFDFNDEDGTLKYNGESSSFGYQEFFTAETAASGTPEIEEINTQGPDLTEVDSLQYWEKQYWKETEIPFDRIDPNSSEVFNFVDVTNMRKIEINFSKFITSIRKLLSEIILKPILIQLTIKELEIGVDLNLLDSIQIEWVAFNEYDKLGELEILAKKVEVATNLAAFGEQEDASGTTRHYLPLTWIVDNYMDFTPEQKIAMEAARRREAIELGFMTEDGKPIPHGDDVKDADGDGEGGDNDEVNADPDDDEFGLGDDEDEDKDDDNPSGSDDEGFSK